MTYTNESKTSVDVPFRTSSEVTFLKRRFVFDGRLHRTLAPIELEVILEAPYWTKSTSPEEEVEKTFNTMIKELSLHDEATFNKWMPIMCSKALERINYIPTIVDQRMLRKMACEMDVYM